MIPAIEMQHCTGCGQDKPLQQFQVTKSNRDGSTWVKTRKWCFTCCEELFEKQRSADESFRAVAENRHAKCLRKREARIAALPLLPDWCDVDAVDFLVNGERKHGARASAMAVLWKAFQQFERAAGEPLGGRGARFMKTMAEIFGEDETKFRQKLRRMCRHDDDLLLVFETAPSSKPRTLRPVQT